MSTRFIFNATKTVALAGAGAVTGWSLYSRFAINHDVALPPALDAPQRSLESTWAGQVNYYAEDAAEGKPLVLVHSVNAAASAMEMKPLFEHYRGQRPVYALDLPGYGFSDRSPREYTPQLFADVIAEFIEQVVGEAADVIALSLGCEFAARAAVARPDLFHSLVFLSPTGFTGEGDEGRTERASRRDGSDRAYRLLSNPLWSQPLYDLIASPPSIRYFLGMSFTGTPPQSLIDYGYRTAHQPGAKNVPLHFLSGRLFTGNIRSTLYEQLAVPTLVLYDQDPYVDFSDLPQLLASNSCWQAERILHTKGLPHWEKLDETTTSIDRFWQEESTRLLEPA